MKEITPKEFTNITKKLRSRFDVEMFEARRRIAQQLKLSFQANFSRQGYGGRPWAERVTGGSWPIFQKSKGRMKSNIAILMMTDDIIEVGIPEGSSTPFAHYHNDPPGGSGVSNNKQTGRFTSNNNSQTWKRNQYTDEPIERRQFIGFDEKLERFTIKAIELALKRTFK